ncbi:hypothetical protein SCUP515_12582 [Seiridium cupressi]
MTELKILADILLLLSAAHYAELVQQAPPNGWPAITVETLHDFGVHKTDEAVALLQRLPYLDNSAAFIAPETIPCDHRLLGRKPDSRTPGWAYDVPREDAEWPAWVIQLTSGASIEKARVTCWTRRMELLPSTLRLGFSILPREGRSESAPQEQTSR